MVDRQDQEILDKINRNPDYQRNRYIAIFLIGLFFGFMIGASIG